MLSTLTGSFSAFIDSALFYNNFCEDPTLWLMPNLFLPGVFGVLGVKGSLAVYERDF